MWFSKGPKSKNFERNDFSIFHIIASKYTLSHAWDRNISKHSRQKRCCTYDNIESTIVKWKKRIHCFADDNGGRLETFLSSTVFSNMHNHFRLAYHYSRLLLFIGCVISTIVRLLFLFHNMCFVSKSFKHSHTFIHLCLKHLKFTNL